MEKSANITLVKTEADISRCVETMQHLRPHLVPQNFVSQVLRQFKQGYQLAVIFDEGTAASLMGFRIQEFLAWGRVLYIDDLITHPNCLKRGHAGQLLDWAEEYAKKNGCEQVHLDSGYQRNDAHRLYLNKGFDLVSHHFAKKL